MGLIYDYAKEKAMDSSEYVDSDSSNCVGDELPTCESFRTPEELRETSVRNSKQCAYLHLSKINREMYEAALGQKTSITMAFETNFVEYISKYYFDRKYNLVIGAVYNDDRYTDYKVQNITFSWEKQIKE